MMLFILRKINKYTKFVIDPITKFGVILIYHDCFEILIKMNEALQRALHFTSSIPL